MKKNAKHDGPGRPRYTPKFPRSKEFTFTQFMEVNDIDIRPEVNGKRNKTYGKGPHCTMLTLRKFLARDAARKGRSMLFRVRGVTADPNSDAGLGRRGYLYSVRAGTTIAPKSTVTAAPRKTRTVAPKVNKPVETVTADGTVIRDEVSEGTKSYEDLKAILSAPTPVLPPEVPTVLPVVAPVTVPVVEVAHQAAEAVQEAPEAKEEAPVTSSETVAA